MNGGRRSAGYNDANPMGPALKFRADRAWDQQLVWYAKGAMARGVAYGTRSPNHLLNVPAGLASSFTQVPEGGAAALRVMVMSTFPCPATSPIWRARCNIRLLGAHQAGS